MMKTIGFSFKKISAERKQDLKGKVEVKSHINIDEIEKDSVDVAGDVLKVSYTYIISYEPSIAQIEFKGGIIIGSSDKEEIKDVLKEWKKKQLSEKIQLYVYNFILTKCSLKALQIEEEFALPSHVPMPRFQKPSDKTPKSSESANYTG
jgi:hypothetical protein